MSNFFYLRLVSWPMSRPVSRSMSWLVPRFVSRTMSRSYRGTFSQSKSRLVSRHMSRSSRSTLSLLVPRHFVFITLCLDSRLCPYTVYRLMSLHSVLTHVSNRCPRSSILHQQKTFLPRSVFLVLAWWLPPAKSFLSSYVRDTGFKAGSFFERRVLRTGFMVNPCQVLTLMQRLNSHDIAP